MLIASYSCESRLLYTFVSRFLLSCQQQKRKRELEKKEGRESRKKAKLDTLGLVSDQPEDREQFEEVPIEESQTVAEQTFADETDEEDAKEEYVPKTPDELAEVRALGG